MQSARQLPTARPRSSKDPSLLFYKETLQVRGRLLQAQQEPWFQYQPEMTQAQGLKI